MPVIRIPRNRLFVHARDRSNEFFREVEAASFCTENHFEIHFDKWRELLSRFPRSYRVDRGLGDIVAAIAEPIARASDAVLGTKLVGCQSCADRRAALNKLVPKL